MTTRRTAVGVLVRLLGAIVIGSAIIGGGIMAAAWLGVLPWHRSPYYSPTVTEGPRGAMRIEAADTAGMYFRTLRGPGVHRLRMRGRGTASVRVHAPGGSLDYLSAPADGGELQWYLEGPGVMEVLLYAPDELSYTLDTIELAPCDDCTRASDLRSRILREMGRSFEPTVSFAHLLLDWTAHTVNDGASMTLPLSPILMDRPAIWYDYWRHNAGGGLCGDFAAYFVATLRLFGFEALVADVGERGTLATHVTSVLAMPGGERGYRFWILDPTLNGFYANKDGSPASLAQVLADEEAYPFVTTPTVRDVVSAQGSVTTGQVNTAAFWSAPARRVAAGRDVLLSLLRKRLISVGYGSPVSREAFRELLSSATAGRQP